LAHYCTACRGGFATLAYQERSKIPANSQGNFRQGAPRVAIFEVAGSWALALRHPVRLVSLACPISISLRKNAKPSGISRIVCHYGHLYNGLFCGLTSRTIPVAPGCKAGTSHHHDR